MDTVTGEAAWYCNFRWRYDCMSTLTYIVTAAIDTNDANTASG